MKRWLTRILICLAMGVVTTVGVALAAAKWSTGAWSPTPALSPEEKETLTDSFGMSEMDLAWLSYSIVGGLAAEWRFYNPHYSGPVLMTGRFGWPFSALGYERRREWRGVKEGVWPNEMFHWLSADITSDTARKTAIASQWNISNASRPTPDTVHAKGFALDAFLYAAVWFAVLVGFSAVRRTRRALRKRHGHCPMCGYDLRGDLDVGCPECGWNRPGSES